MRIGGDFPQNHRNRRSSRCTLQVFLHLSSRGICEDDFTIQDLLPGSYGGSRTNRRNSRDPLGSELYACASLCVLLVPSILQWSSNTPFKGSPYTPLDRQLGAHRHPPQLHAPSAGVLVLRLHDNVWLFIPSIPLS